jgi:hypothetical protein
MKQKTTSFNPKDLFLMRVERQYGARKKIAFFEQQKPLEVLVAIIKMVNAGKLHFDHDFPGPDPLDPDRKLPPFNPLISSSVELGMYYHAENLLLELCHQFKEWDFTPGKTYPDWRKEIRALRNTCRFEVDKLLLTQQRLLKGYDVTLDIVELHLRFVYAHRDCYTPDSRGTKQLILCQELKESLCDDLLKGIASTSARKLSPEQKRRWYRQLLNQYNPSSERYKAIAKLCPKEEKRFYPQSEQDFFTIEGESYKIVEKPLKERKAS